MYIVLAEVQIMMFMVVIIKKGCLPNKNREKPRKYIKLRK